MAIRRMLSFLLTTAAFSATCLAGGTTYSTTIVELGIQKNLGNFVLIKTAATVSTPPACSVNGYWAFTLPLTSAGDRELYAMLLAAHAGGKTVHLTGTGTCNEYGSIESLATINVF